MKVKLSSKFLKKYYDWIIGIDLGNGLIKIRSVHKNGEIYRKRLPSAYTDSTSLGVSITDSTLDLDFYEINKTEYIWGKDVVEIGNIIPTHGYEGRYSTIGYRNMVKMTLARVYNDLGIMPNDKVLIVTGVPSTETGTDAESQLKNAFTNNGEVHDVIMNGKQMLIKLEEEDIFVMSQPVATVLGRYLGDNGEVIDKRYETMKVAVVDIGGGTTDFDIIKNLRRLNEYDSIQNGFHDVYEAIRAEIQSIHRTSEPTDFDLLKRISYGIKHGNVFTYRPNIRVEPVDFSDTLEKAVLALAGLIQSKITSKWKAQADIDEFLLVGGSAGLFEVDIKEVANAVVIPQNNGDSNAEGYFKFGVHENNKMEESVIF